MAHGEIDRLTELDRHCFHAKPSYGSRHIPLCRVGESHTSCRWSHSPPRRAGPQSTHDNNHLTEDTSSSLFSGTINPDLTIVGPLCVSGNGPRPRDRHSQASPRLFLQTLGVALQVL
ncbi:hypothetical protein J6590_046422 [Homalodisca vitripennis]|nr:hypothetical protein J6590_046422 [Homalodisca vitripennis]